MVQTYVEVFFWDWRLFSTKVGHASIKLTTGRRHRYVSWWPAADEEAIEKKEGKFAGKKAKRGKGEKKGAGVRDGFCETSYDGDVKSEGRRADEVITFDIELERDWSIMVDEVLSEIDEKYSLGTTNCAFVVIEILLKLCEANGKMRPMKRKIEANRRDPNTPGEARNGAKDIKTELEK